MVRLACLASPSSHKLTSSAAVKACFLTPGWKIRNIGDYVGTLFGVRLSSRAPRLWFLLPSDSSSDIVRAVQIFFMVVALEAIRRLSREYDRRIRKAYIHRETLALQVFAQNMNKGQPSEPAPFR